MLFKAVALAILLFAMSYFKISKILCFELESLMAYFWWGHKNYERKIYWIGWDKMCLSKFKGCLGFKDSNSFNLALLTKQGWIISHNEYSLLHRIYKVRYFLNSSFFISI